ncbi:MAG: hypothetical protein ABW003_13110 [Microvirga sp.]
MSMLERIAASIGAGRWRFGLFRSFVDTTKEQHRTEVEAGTKREAVEAVERAQLGAIVEDALEEEMGEQEGEEG